MRSALNAFMPFRVEGQAKRIIQCLAGRQTLDLRLRGDDAAEVAAIHEDGNWEAVVSPVTD
ncbi:hypothetical protein D6C00_06265 [Thiohalobacter thiocyanaticus]|uniref:Uncharacterized protein n=1 Tax=Thiohalobacter thiocyanaticus TaxID=585455 RepID=A0A426QIK8_9GAMM|nr:hypothetical protein D6C00_06265 [Thiohalobacter thiocyanaticus]